MFEYYFYESNRDIVTENVVKCYSMISKYGFQPSMGKIKMVEGDDLKGEKEKSKISCRWTAPVNCYGDFGIRGQVYF